VLTEEKLDDIGTRLEHTPRKSLTPSAVFPVPWTVHLNGPVCCIPHTVRQAVRLVSKAHKYGNNYARMAGIELLSSEKNKVFLKGYCLIGLQLTILRLFI
jgi:hypothetical protein